MFALITGGSASGKSEFAERLAVQCHHSSSPMIYIATMQPFDDESYRRIDRHRRMRKDKNFDTVECYTNLADLVLEPTTVLLECMSNLVANELYSPSGAGEQTVSRVIAGVDRLLDQAGNLIVVTNEVFSDGITYDTSTMEYLNYLGEINCRMAKAADLVAEVVYHVPVYWKGEGNDTFFAANMERF